MEVAKICRDKKHIAHSYSFVGAAYTELSQYKLALENLMISERMYSEEKDSLGIAMVLLDLAIVNSELDDELKSMENTRRAAKIYKAAGRDINYAIAMIDLCTGFLELEMPDSALKYLDECQAIVEGKHELALVYVYQHLGNANLQKGNYEEANSHFQQSLTLLSGIGDKMMEGTLNNFLVELELARDNPTMALQYALRSDSISKAFPQTKSRAKTLIALAKAAYAAKEYDLSFKSYEGYISLHDSLLGSERLREITNLEQAYEAEKRENLIQLQEQENELLKAENQASNNRNIALAIALLLLGSLAYALLNRQRLKMAGQKAKLQLRELENQRLGRELEFKNQELTAKVLHIAQKNELLSSLKQSLSEMESTKKEDSGEINSLVNTLRVDEQINDNWEQFTSQFTELNPDFYQKLTQNHQKLSKSDLRLAALLRMNLSTKDIARVLNISEDGVKKARHRLRKKIELQSEESLEAYVLSL